MTIPLKQHRRIVFLLVGAILLLCVLLVVVMLRTDIVEKYGTLFAGDNAEVLSPENLDAPKTPFLGEEEVFIIKSVDEEEIILPVKKVLFEYVEVLDGCGHHFEGECLNVRSGPGTEYPVVARLRNGIVLKVDGKVEHGESTWYKIIFDEWLRYPERVTGDWYVAANYVKVLLDEGNQAIENQGNAASTKQIIVDRSDQILYAYENDELFMQEPISTGLELTPTPRGIFSIYKKTPSRYMQGPIPDIANQYYDLPGVPWNLYFTHGGAVIHGAYWHDSFGTKYSHGCVNLPPKQAYILYTWAELGTRVIVRD